MTIQIRPTRMELNDRFPMLGFSIRSDGDVDKYEVVIASDPTLFAPDAKGRRTRSNFYSSRAAGPFPIQRDEAMYVLPPEVLVRFLGQPKLYFATAGYNGSGPAKADIGTLPSAASPYISLSGLSGRSLRRARVLPSRQSRENSYGSGNNAELEWAGDAVLPGMAPVNGKPGDKAPLAIATPAAAHAASLQYDDGFGELPPAPPPTPVAATATAPAADAAQAPEHEREHNRHHRHHHHHHPEAKKPYGAAVDARAASLGTDIPLDPGNGGMSIGPDALMVGDIILSTTAAATSGVIRFATGSAVSHAMLYVGQGQQVIEAVGTGVVMRPLSDALAEATVAVAFRAPDINAAARQLIADAAAPHVGEPYDTVGIVRQGLFQIDRHVCDLLSGAAADNCRRFVGAVDLGTQRPGTFFCSSLVVAAYAQAGCPLTATPPNFTTPENLAEIALRSGALAYVGHLKAPPVETGRSLFGLGMSAGALAADDVMALANRFGPVVARGAQDALAQGAPEAEVLQFLQGMGVAAPAAASAMGAQTARALGGEVPVSLPAPVTLSGWKATLARAAIGAALGGPLGPIFGAAAMEELGAACTRANVCVGLGPALSAGLLAGGSLSAGVIIAPGGDLGFYGRVETAVGALAGVSATLQVTVTKGGLDHFGGRGFAVGLTVDLDPAVVGGALLLDEDHHFHGVAVQVGLGLAANPFEIYLAAERTVVAAQSLGVQSLGVQSLGVQSLGAATISVNWDDVELIAQPTDNSCWATAAAMVLGWADRVSLSAETVAAYCGRTTALGLSPNDRQAFADAAGLRAEPPQSYSVAGFQKLLESYGPLWVSVQLPGSGHAIVVTGMVTDGAADGSGTFVRIADPWDRVVGGPGTPGAYLNTHASGSRYILTWADFSREYEARASTAPGGTVNVQILHAADTGGRTPNALSPPTSAWAMAAPPLPPPPPARHARAMDAGVVEITSAVVGAVMSRVLGGESNITWELDQLNGIKHPNDAAPAPAIPYRDATAIKLVDWPYVEALDSDQISAWFAIDWQFNGLSLGNVRISNIGTNGALLQKLKVRAQIMNDAILYPAAGPRMAALRIRFHYLFTRAIGSDSIAMTDLHLFANGTFDQTSSWIQ